MATSVDVSVIVTSYNVERYIERAIRSALGQQGVTLEVIVADDCSDDSTCAVIESIGDPRIKLIRFASNGGPSVARNAAIAQARGQWLAVLDGDDVFLPGRLQRCLALAAARKADVVVDNLEVQHEADGKCFPMFPTQRLQATPTLTVEAFIAGNSNFAGGYGLGYMKPIISTAFLKRHALRYPESIRIGEDYLLLLEALALGAVCAVEPTVGYGYTARAGSISHRLTSADVARIQSTDAAFFARYQISDKARRFQEKRARNLVKTYAFTEMVEAIKHRDWLGFLKTMFHQPLAVLYFWQPVWVRIKRFLV